MRLYTQSYLEYLHCKVGGFKLSLDVFFFTWTYIQHVRLPWWLSGKESSCNAGHAGDEDLFPEGEISSGGGAWQPILVLLPGESYGLRSLVSYSL